MRKQPGFFDIHERLTRLSDLGDQLEGFRAAVDFELFRSDLDQALAYSDGVSLPAPWLQFGPQCVANTKLLCQFIMPHRFVAVSSGDNATPNHGGDLVASG